MSSRAVLRCAIAAVLFGVSAPLAAQLADDLGAFSLAGLLYVGAAVAVVPVLGRARPSRVTARRAAPRLAIAVVVRRCSRPGAARGRAWIRARRRRRRCC